MHSYIHSNLHPFIIQTFRVVSHVIARAKYRCLYGCGVHTCNNSLPAAWLGVQQLIAAQHVATSCACSIQAMFVSAHDKDRHQSRNGCCQSSLHVCQTIAILAQLCAPHTYP